MRWKGRGITKGQARKREDREKVENEIKKKWLKKINK